jgi:hypothetical protein
LYIIHAENETPRRERGPTKEKTMKAYVSGVRPHHAGFGQYHRDEAVAVEGDWTDVEEYASHVASTNPLILSYATDPDIAEMGDEDGEKLADALRSATGAVLGGHDTLVAYWLGSEIILESVELVDEVGRE